MLSRFESSGLVWIRENLHAFVHSIGGFVHYLFIAPKRDYRSDDVPERGKALPGAGLGQR
jgi:hypothetical protein